MSFAQYYSLKDYQSLVTETINEKKNTTPDYQKLSELTSSFDKAILKYLNHLIDLNLLTNPKNGSTHSSMNLESWRGLINKKLKSGDIERIQYMFSAIVFNNANSVANDKSNEKEEIKILNGYNKLIEKIDSGNFTRFDLSGSDNCWCCDRKMIFQAKNWVMYLISPEVNEHKKMEFKITPDCLEDKISEVVVDFQTGEILISDWFRIPEFTKFVEYNQNYDKPSINSDLGKIKSTEHAANLGFVTVHVGNTCPQIYSDGDNFIFGYLDENNEKKYKSNGSICTDLWNVTIIDKFKLIDIVAQSMTYEDAKKTVNEYIKENKDSIHFFNVNPGQYTIKFHPHKLINKLTDEIPHEINAKFYMQRNKLSKKLKIN